MPTDFESLAFFSLRLGCPGPVLAFLEELLDKAKENSQRTLFGIGFARILNKI